MRPLGGWSYILLALLVAIEGPSATILGAVMASTGALRLPWVFVAASAGNLSADVSWYLLGSLGRLQALSQRFGWVRKREAQIMRLEHEMKQHALKILLVAKLTLGLVVPALIAAGIARVPWRRWFPIIFIAECIWTGGLVLAGFHLTEYIRQLEIGLEVLAIAGTVAVAGILIWIIRRVGRRAETHSFE